jgi:triacylglycerol lipase
MEVRDYLQFATIAYENEKHGLLILSELANSARFFDAQEFTGLLSDAQFYAIFKDNELIFAFRGSSSWSDFITDANIHQVPAIEGLVHEGFLKQYESIQKVIMTILQQTKLNKISFVGHSLGGAIATICALCFKIQFPSKTIQCYTFGSPRVGNQAFVDAFNKSVDVSVRVVNGQDIVPTRPYWGYAHVKGLFSVGPPYSIWKYWGSIQDHRTDQYQNSCS